MAFSFNGTNQYLEVGPPPVSAVPLTLACWAKSSSLTKEQVLLAVTNGLGGGTGAFFLISLRGDVAGDPVYAVQYNGTSFPSSVGPAYTTNTWNHIVGVFESNASRTVYLNGAAGTTNTTSITATAQTLTHVSIGALKRVPPTVYTEGEIAEPAIWNAALTAAEIASLAKGMTPDKIRPQNLVFYAPLVRDLQDVRGGLTITNNNGATVANHPRVYA
jgi:hypothetical protein